MDFSGKRILFFSAQAFGIPENIVACISKKGGVVDYFDERPANNFLVKAIIRFNRKLIAAYINSYHKKIIEKTKNIHYDYILFVKGESISNSNLISLFNYHKDAIKIIYHWDSIANAPHVRRTSSYFSNVYSFDKIDCKKYGYKFLPLFYFDEFKEIAYTQKSPKYDMMFVGTVHSDRYRFISNIASQIESHGGTSFIYLFFQGKIMFYKYKLKHPEIRHIKISDVHFTPMKKSQLMDMYAISNIIIDIQHPKQTGLTMRCFEALGARKKLITTNKYIKDYDFYNQNNILIVDRQHPVIPKDFINTPFESIDPIIYNKYSISSWVDQIFSSSNN